MENILGSDRDRQNQNDGGRLFKESYKNLKKIYGAGKKVVEVARWLFSILPGGLPTIIFIVVFVLIILAFLSIFFGLMAPIPGGKTPSLPDEEGRFETIPGLILTLVGPEKIANTDNLQYIIEVDYARTSPPLSSIIVYAPLSPSVEFVGATGAFEYSSTGVVGGEVVWPMNQNSNSFTLTLRPTVGDTVIEDYRVYARLSAGASGSAGAPASADSCGGKYNLADTPVGANFGDPDCGFTKDDLYNLLAQIDPSNADRWYFKIVPCESGYNPNAYNGAAVDAAGAFGLFQMGRGKNGQYDHGDVDWATQASNAITYNKDLIGSSFAYWACK